VLTKTAFYGQRVLVTGCCGTIGTELVRQLLDGYGIVGLVGIDNNESELFFQEQRHAATGKASFQLADIRDPHTLVRVMDGVDVVFHTAAFKHVVLCERSPFEAVQTNILGVQNVIAAATACGVRRVIFTSSDKAVNPTNVMGTSKLMGERLFTAANCAQREGGPVFASCRFGNVLGSRGSVIPIFREQIRKGGPVTLTHPEMTRFIMSIRQAVEMVIASADLARGGEVFITKMNVVRIQDLAEVMIRELAPQFGRDPGEVGIEIIGTKPGEKMYEELMTDEETRRTWELPSYFAVHPAFQGMYRDIVYDYPEIVGQQVEKVYNSCTEVRLDHDSIRGILRAQDLLEPSPQPEAHPASRYWPGG